tara:strand:+ start:303 stop:818 length:516 start_codon:yes stop_codon:yes gene_type:complete
MTVYDHQKPVTGPLSFRHFYVVEYRPGEDELTNYRAKKRRNGAMYEHHKKDADGNPIPHDDEEMNEALTLQQRQKRGRIMKRLKARIKIGRERQKRKMADKGRLQKRAVKQARNQLVKKITKGKSKRDLSFARRQEIEKRLEKPAMKKRIERLAKRMFPSIRRAEVQRKKG